ncbi:MAG: hypothetical protein MJZ41_05150 [Bacteroidaceae bacterium]|nr:hypothetical protein [Bacteroidaceae bacterium]
MGFFSAIGGFLSGVGSAISSAVSAVGRCLTEGCARLANGLGSLLKIGLERAVQVVATIAEVIKSVAVLILNRPVDDPEQLGAKMMQQDVRERRSDESMAEYLDYLREQVKLDKDKFEKMSDQEKLACKVVGTSAIATAVSEESGVSFSPEFLLAIEKCKLTDKQVAGYINHFKENNLDSMNKVVEYLEDAPTLSDDERLTVQGALREAELEINPDMTEDQFYDMTDNMKELIKAPIEENAVEDSFNESETVEGDSFEFKDNIEDNSIELETNEMSLEESVGSADSNLENEVSELNEEDKTEK